jgi:hypothetical protein
MNSVIDSTQQEDSGGGEPRARGAHIYRPKVDQNYAARLLSECRFFYLRPRNPLKPTTAAICCRHDNGISPSTPLDFAQELCACLQCFARVSTPRLRPQYPSTLTLG